MLITAELLTHSQLFQRFPAVLVGAVVNIVLDPVFIFGLNMGVRGAALATVLAQCVSAVWVTAFLLGKRTKLKLQRRFFRLKSSVILPVAALGVSPFIMQSTESLVTVSFTASLCRYGGDPAVGAMTICASVAFAQFGASFMFHPRCL